MCKSIKIKIIRELIQASQIRPEVENNVEFLIKRL
jgi:hypothetical protein